jgi:hypothetical protein
MIWIASKTFAATAPSAGAEFAFDRVAQPNLEERGRPKKHNSRLGSHKRNALGRARTEI